ncbi:RNA polymerase sigma factor [Flagellimonas sp. S174]|uniref:RNA polymerase sigma factor n=1 Tax=Flagellimonas sp. S174 TaxID=3410790 RepID=UPI003BF59012
MIDKELIESCLKDDKIAQKKFYVFFAKQMFIHCYRYVKNKEDAEEIVSEGFIKVFQSLPRFEYRDVKSTAAWVKRIMINESLMFLRKNHKLVGNPSLEPMATDETGTEMDMDASDIYALILHLPLGYRTVFNLYAIEGYTHKEIAEKLSIGESTSRSQLAKARAMLKKNVKVWNQ